jgi:hypothetical protein
LLTQALNAGIVVNAKIYAANDRGGNLGSNETRILRTHERDENHN